jgi:hypothetical protein
MHQYESCVHLRCCLMYTRLLERHIIYICYFYLFWINLQGGTSLWYYMYYLFVIWRIVTRDTSITTLSHMYGMQSDYHTITATTAVWLPYNHCHNSILYIYRLIVTSLLFLWMCLHNKTYWCFMSMMVIKSRHSINLLSL